MIWLVLTMWLLGFALLKHVPGCPPAPKMKGSWPLSIVVPTRNEERNIQRLLNSIARLESHPMEILVIDDGSTDATATVAREMGATVFPAPPLPDGWLGKTWACHQGAKRARGDYLLFLDADVVLKPDALDRIRAACRKNDCKVLSLGPYHEVEKPYEQLSAFFNLTTHMGMGAFSLWGSPRKPSGLFGPFFLVERALYFAVGGHEAVREEILEHMSLAAKLRAIDSPMLCLGGREVVHTRMYPQGLSSLVEGWSKAFASGAAKTEPPILTLSVLWMSGAMVACALGLFGLFGQTGLLAGLAIYAAYAWQLYFFLRQLGNFSLIACLAYPVLLAAFFFIFGRSVFLRVSGRGVTWKGRSVPAAGKKPADH